MINLPGRIVRLLEAESSRVTFTGGPRSRGGFGYAEVVGPRACAHF